MAAEVDESARVCTRFWLDAGYEAWFTKNETFDAEFRERFLDDHHAAARRELDHWIEHPESAFALMVLLDQFPRNSFRGTAHMYATDPLARVFATKALADKHDRHFDEAARVFFYLPFMHSEALPDQELCVELCRPLSENTLRYAIEHRDIIKRFGRFPHRNPMLGRETTADEQAFLDSGGFAG